MGKTLSEWQRHMFGRGEVSALSSRKKRTGLLLKGSKDLGKSGDIDVLMHPTRCLHSMSQGSILFQSRP